MNLSVNLADFQHGVDFNQDAMNYANLSSEQLANLAKALEAGPLQGGDLNDPSQTNAGALKVESLEESLKILTLRQSDIRFWRRMPKAPAFNTIEEFNQQTSVGTDRGGFNNEGELPEEEDSEFVRRAERVKYLGVTRSVTHQMQLVRTNIGSIMQKETESGMLWILRKADRALFFGNEALISQEWNGLYTQHFNNPKFSTLDQYHDSRVVIDLRGKALDEANIEEGSRVVLENFGYADLLVAPPIVLSDFATRFYENKRVNVGQAGAVKDAVMGQSITKFQGMYGLINFEFDIFAAKSPGKLSSASATSPKSPAAPTSVGVTVQTGIGSSKFSDGIGDYFYAVTSSNRYGESAMTQLGGTVTVANADDAVDLEFTATAGPYQPTGYTIYRSILNPTGAFGATVMYPILYIPATGTGKGGSLAAGVDGASAGEIRDNNRWLPATEEAMLLQADTQVIEFKQLAPLMKMPLARLSPADRFMVLLYGTPFLYQPDKMIRYINIGRDIT